MFLGSTAAFPLGEGPLHTHIPVLLESDHHTETDHRKYYSTSRGQGSRILTYREMRCRETSPPEIIRNQYLQRVLQVILQALA